MALTVGPPAGGTFVRTARKKHNHRSICSSATAILDHVQKCEGGFGMTPWCVVLVCSWRRVLADRHSLPFP